MVDEKLAKYCYCNGANTLFDIGRLDNYAALKDYILGQLGSPFICVELNDAQLQNIIGDCVRYFWRYANGGTYEDYLAFELKQGITHYKVCQELEEVVSFETPDWLGDANKCFTPAHTLIYSDFMAGPNSFVYHSSCYGTAAGSTLLGNWNACLTWLEEARMDFGAQYQVKYIRESKELLIKPTPTKDSVGLIRVFKRNKVQNIMQDPLFREMVVAKAGMIWTAALRKYSITISGGGTLNADSLYSSFKERLDAVQERIYLENPNYDFIVG